VKDSAFKVVDLLRCIDLAKVSEVVFTLIECRRFGHGRDIECDWLPPLLRLGWVRREEGVGEKVFVLTHAAVKAGRKPFRRRWTPRQDTDILREEAVKDIHILNLI
jgi:hypothetical protein